MSLPKISILIPIFNAEKLILDTLTSISIQDYSDWECILVDDGSTDDSVGVIQNYIQHDTRFRFYRRPAERKKGANACRNYAFEKSTGEWIIWFDADDVMLPKALTGRALLTDQVVAFVITSQNHANADLSVTKEFERYFYPKNLFVDYALWRLKIITGSVMFRRTFLEGKQLFLDHLLKSQEAELFGRLFFDAKPEQFKISNAKTFLYRSHSFSSTSKNQQYRSAYKSSEIYTVSENLKRGLLIQSHQLVSSMYRLLVNLLHKAVINHDRENIRFIKKVLNENLKQKNKTIILMLTFVVGLHRLLPKKGIRWDALFKKLPIRI